MKMVGTAKELNTLLDALPRYAGVDNLPPAVETWAERGVRGFFRGVDIDIEIVEPEQSEAVQVKSLVEQLRGYGAEGPYMAASVPKALLRLAADVIEGGGTSDESEDVVRYPDGDVDDDF